MLGEASEVDALGLFFHWELLGKAQGDFIERTESNNLNVHAQLDRLEVLTDEQIDELLAIVEGKKKALLEGAW